MDEESSANYMLAPETNGKPLKVLESVWRPETNDFTFDLKALVRFLTERKGTKVFCIPQHALMTLPLASCAFQEMEVGEGALLG